MNKIYTLTLNSAFEEVVYQKEGKILSYQKYLTGKAVNTGLILSNIGIPCQMHVVCGEDTEKQYNELNQSNRKVFVYSVEGKTRINQTIVSIDEGEFKKINFGYHLSEENANIVKADLLKCVTKDDFVLVAGSLPRGMDKRWYRQLISELQMRGTHVLYDAAGEVLKEGIKSAPFYIKPNEEELREIIGEFEMERVPEILKEMAHTYGIKNVVVTLGEYGACGYQMDTDMFARGRSTEHYSKEVMTTGCGDSFNAGFLYGLCKEYDFKQCMKYGIAFSTANIFAGFPEKITWENICERMKYISVD